MIAIIAEKPSVGREIARIAGATEAKDGYMEGNGYSVTWALGHLVQLALPGTYGYTRTSGDNLPLLPDPFQLVIRQRKTDRGMATDPVAAKQLRTIDSVFSRCSAIIVATDAGREGELIFRYIYSYLGYTKPFRRLWISSLTDEAIRKGLSELKEGTEYDSLYHAADCRAKADWLVGINASQALAIASGTFNQSLGRVQTPTLAMICARFKENREFVPTDYWQLSVTLKKGDDFRQFRHVENILEKTEADRLYDRITTDSMATITKTERKRGFQAPPLLYDLTALQKDCNVHLDLSAEKTLAVAQSLYEKKLISYPRTGSRYIPDDVMRQVPDLLRGVIGMKEFREYGGTLDWDNLSTRSVNAGKVTDHHALIVTGVQPVMETLNEQELAVYRMIAGRMLEAFSPKCEKETLVIETTVDGLDVPFPLRFRGQTGLESRIQPFGRQGEGRGDGKQRHGPIRRIGNRPRVGAQSCKEKDHAQAAIHGSHTACGHGELRQGAGRRGGARGDEGAGHRNSGDPCGRHRHPFQAGIRRTFRESTRADRQGNGRL